MREFLCGIIAGYLFLALSILSQFALVPVLLHASGKELAGVYLMLITLANAASIGIGWVVTPMQRKMIRDGSAGGPGPHFAYGLLWWVMFGYGIFVLIICIACAALVRVWFLPYASDLHIQTVQSCLVALGVYILASFIVQADLTLLTARLRQTEANLLRCLQPAGFLVLLMVFSSAGGMHIDLLLWGNAMVALCVGAAIRVRNARLGNGGIGRMPRYGQIVEALQGEGWRYQVFVFAQFALLYGDILIVGMVLGSAASADLVIVWRIAEAAVTILVRIPECACPYLTRHQAEGRLEVVARIHLLVSRGTLLAALLFSIIYATFGHAISVLWVGAERLDAEPWWFMASSVIVLLLVANRTQIAAHVALGEVHRITLILIVEWSFKLVLVLVLVPRLGLGGLLIAGLAAHGLASMAYFRSIVCLLAIVRQRLWREVCGPILAGASAASVTLVLVSAYDPSKPSVSCIAAIVVSCVCYVMVTRYYSTSRLLSVRDLMVFP